MMAGDLLVGRAFSPAGRRRLSTPLRYLLSVPYLLFAVQPAVPLAVVVAAVASVGYAATLGQQEELVALTPAGLRGQVLGVESSVRMTLQGVCAAAAGLLADLLSPATAVVLLAAASTAVSLALTAALAHAGARSSTLLAMAPSEVRR